jgi:prevent-host-death family protein
VRQKLQIFNKVGNITTLEVFIVERVVSAADANRRFSELLRTVRDGQSVVVTSHGRPIARIVPIGKDENISLKARSALLKRLRSERVTTIGHWQRDELYQDAK